MKDRAREDILRAAAHRYLVDGHFDLLSECVLNPQEVVDEFLANDEWVALAKEIAAEALLSLNNLVSERLEQPRIDSYVLLPFLKKVVTDELAYKDWEVGLGAVGPILHDAFSSKSLEELFKAAGFDAQGDVDDIMRMIGLAFSLASAHDSLTRKGILELLCEFTAWVEL